MIYTIVTVCESLLACDRGKGFKQDCSLSRKQMTKYLLQLQTGRVCVTLTLWCFLNTLHSFKHIMYNKTKKFAEYIEVKEHSS